MNALDDLDLAILAELEQNARISISELARRLDSPNSTIRDRIHGLEEDEVILGYKAIVNPDKLGLGIKAVIQTGRAQSISLEDFCSEATEFPEITRVQIVTGETDQLVTVYVRDVEHLKEVIFDKVGALPGLTKSNTTIVLEERNFPLTRRFFSKGRSGDLENA
jgi:Lrp/AsnC family leucine-responsive transcriptional regulator